MQKVSQNQNSVPKQRVVYIVCTMTQGMIQYEPFIQDPLQEKALCYRSRREEDEMFEALPLEDLMHGLPLKHELSGPNERDSSLPPSQELNLASPKTVPSLGNQVKLLR